jgi:deoxyribonuclease-4
LAIFGSHKSIAGGYYKAVEQAASCGCDCVQLFTKNNNQWRAKDLSDEDVSRFRAALADLNISHPIAHDSYLINLAACDDLLWKKSIDAFVIELQRAERLGLAYVVMHPGAYTTSSEELGINRCIQAFEEIHSQTRGLKVITLIETTAGQGSCLGCRFEQIATILDRVRDSNRLGVCLDTCHIFAAGYPLATSRQYKATFKSLDTTIGINRVKAIHLNDSKKDFGSRVDRHEHIGRGKIGLDAFRHLVNDSRFSQVPMYLETPKVIEEGEEMDVVNLRVLRGLIAKDE